MYELIEIDPATGEEDHLITTGTLRRMERELEDLLAEVAEDWDNGAASWPVYRIQPA